MAGLSDYFLTLGFSDDDLTSGKRQLDLLKKMEELQSEISQYSKINTEEAKKETEERKKYVKELEDILGITERIKEENEEADKAARAAAKAAKAEIVEKYLGSAFTKSIDFFKEEFSKAWKELNNTLSFSQLTNSTVRNLKFTYGFSSSEAYGFQNALKTLGISENDLMYMDEQQTKQFQTLMGDFAERYTKLEASGFFTDLQTMNVEWAQFKQDLLMEFAQFFVENKDIIKAGFDDLLKITEAVLYIAGKINDILGGGRYSTGNSSDIIAKYAGTTTNNTTIKIDNSFTGKIDQSSQHSIVNDMTQSFEQIIKSLQ